MAIQRVSRESVGQEEEEAQLEMVKRNNRWKELITSIFFTLIESLTDGWIACVYLVRFSDPLALGSDSKSKWVGEPD